MKHPQSNQENQLLGANEEFTRSDNDKSRSNLRADCKKCFGLCCVALYFSASEGFPINKEAGQPCINLQSDFHCRVHASLAELDLKGCLAFDCFGAGQKVAQVSFGGHDWGQAPESSQQMFAVFLIMRQLHEILWYLTEALTLPSAGLIHGAVSSMLDKTERFTQLRPELLVKVDVAAHRTEVNILLLKTSEFIRAEARCRKKGNPARQKSVRPGADLIAADLRSFDLSGINLRGACLIAVDFRGTDLSGTDLIGADLRDADLRGANLSQSIFLTQAQVNVAKGDESTKLPPSLTRPPHWNICGK